MVPPLITNVPVPSAEFVVLVPCAPMLRIPAFNVQAAVERVVSGKMIGGRVAELSKFAISNEKKSFSLTTNAISGTGIPLASDQAPLVFNMPLIIDVPTAVGTFHFSTTVELLRASPTSKTLSR